MADVDAEIIRVLHDEVWRRIGDSYPEDRDASTVMVWFALHPDAAVRLREVLHLG